MRLTQPSVHSDAGIGKQDIQSSFLRLDSREQTIKIVKLRHITWHGRDIASNVLRHGGQFLLAAAGNENVRTLGDELLCSGQTDTAAATSNERNFSFELTHAFTPLLLRVFTSCRELHQTFETPATRWFRRTQSRSLTQPRL